MHASSPTEHVVTAGANGSARPTGSRRKSASSPAGAYGKEHKTVPAESEPKVTTVVLGNLPLRSWYSSFYPKELVGDQIERLCVCHWCFKYSKELMPYLSHQVCLHLILAAVHLAPAPSRIHVSIKPLQGKARRRLTSYAHGRDSVHEGKAVPGDWSTTGGAVGCTRSMARTSR